MTLHRGHDSTTGQCRVMLWFCSTFQHRPGLKIPNQTFLRSSQAVIQRKYLWNFLESPHKMLMFLGRFKANLKGVRQIIGNRACSFFAVFLITPCNVLCTVYTVNHLLFIKKTKQKTNKNTPKSKQIADNHCLWEKKKTSQKNKTGNIKNLEMIHVKHITSSWAAPGAVSQLVFPAISSFSIYFVFHKGEQLYAGKMFSGCILAVLTVYYYHCHNTATQS